MFLDSRQDPFPAGLVRDHIRLEASGQYADLFAHYDIGCALTVQGSPLAASLQRDGWIATTGEGTWTVFRRPDSFDDSRAGGHPSRPGQLSMLR